MWATASMHTAPNRWTRQHLSKYLWWEAKGAPKSEIQKMLENTIPDGDEGSIRLLIEYGANINAVDIHGLTLLDRAIRQSSLDKVDLLLQLHATPSSARLMEEALHHAAYEANNALVQRILGIFLDSKEDVNRRGVAGFPLLYYPISGKHEQIVKTLLKAGACITNESHNGECAVDWAAMGEESTSSQSILDSILQKAHKNDLKVRWRRLLYIAITTGKNAYTVKRLMECGQDFICTGWVRTALAWTETMDQCSSKKNTRDILSQHNAITTQITRIFHGLYEVPDQNISKVF
ncbi:hypothetical protein VB005_03439 [Metarhizium brunneum]